MADLISQVYRLQFASRPLFLSDQIRHAGIYERQQTRQHGYCDSRDKNSRLCVELQGPHSTTC
jgi:hypothetical protein